MGNLALFKTAAGINQAQYGYDALNRLTHAKDGTTGTPIETYGYDKTGNRTSLLKAGVTTPYTYPATSHRLGSMGSTVHTYDPAGNTASIGGNAREFVYNNANRLAQVKRLGVVKRDYLYNGKGEQVRSFAGTSNTYTVYDEAGHWLGDFGAPTAPFQQAIWLDDLPIGLLTGAGANQTVQYLQPDHLGSPRVAIDAVANTAIWRWDLKGEAFGNTPPNQDPDGNGQAFVLNLRYPGQRFDAASGLNYNYFRDYDPNTGRYVQSDPIGLQGGISTYGYVGGSPVNAVDPLGLFDVRGRRLLGGDNRGQIVYEVQFYNPALGIARDGKMVITRVLPGWLRTAGNALDRAYGKPSGVSSMPRSKRMACDKFDDKAEKIFEDKFGTRTVSESELRWFISEVNKARPDLRYDADVIISEVANGLPPFQ